MPALLLFSGDHTYEFIFISLCIATSRGCRNKCEWVGPVGWLKEAGGVFLTKLHLGVVNLFVLLQELANRPEHHGKLVISVFFFNYLKKWNKISGAVTRWQPFDRRGYDHKKGICKALL